MQNGRKMLVITEGVKYLDLVEIGLPYKTYSVLVTGFQEVDSKTGKVLFEWDSVPRVSLGETSLMPERTGPTLDESEAFDFMHMNSVDKNNDGDYLVSARHTDTIYKVSGITGEIIWRFGGKTSDFVHEGGFNFSKQHDARFLESNRTHTIISFINNAASNVAQSASYSSALVISLHTAAVPMTATILSQYDRPDRGLTRRMGNVQTLPSGSRLVNWSQGGYITEYGLDGKPVLEAGFATDRFASYRVYKHEFVGRPSYPPTVRSFAYGRKQSAATTACYVSWNGATEVASWRFYSHEKDSEISLGEVQRQGFETEFMYDGYKKKVSVEALDAKGVVLGRSNIEDTVRPGIWIKKDSVTEDIVAHIQVPVVLCFILTFILMAALGFITGGTLRPSWPGKRSGYKQLQHEENTEEVI
ncbi:hypothetical protein VI817_004295 [Penicillium citrinum]|nr:hypothetical protein VI817_004295 [Penicillium citrinum]